MKFWQKLPLCFSFVVGTPSGSLSLVPASPGVPASSSIASSSNILIRFENVRIALSSSGCTFNAKTEGVTTCTRTAAGKGTIVFSPAWSTVPNCTISPEADTNANAWALPTTTNLTFGVFDYTLGLGILGKTYGDGGSYAIRCSGTQQ
jgi:hypothetical protein